MSSSAVADTLSYLAPEYTWVLAQAEPAPPPAGSQVGTTRYRSNDERAQELTKIDWRAWR
jgi:hypothetical protein